MAKDWSAVAVAIRDRLSDLDMTQTDLASRSGVSYATIRDLLKNPDARQRNPRTLTALSEALGWPPGHLGAVLAGQDPGDPDAEDPVLAELDRINDTLKSLDQRLDTIERQLAAGDAEP